MDKISEINTTIAHCIVQLNKQLAVGERLGTSPEVILTGEGGTLDSLGLITLFVSLEQELATKHGLSCPLLDTIASEVDTYELSTVGKLTDWISKNAKAAD